MNILVTGGTGYIGSHTVRQLLDSGHQLTDRGESLRLNCGYDQGYSVKEVVQMVKKISGVDFIATETGRRTDNPPSLIADISRIKKELICRSAFEWERNWQTSILNSTL